MPKRILRKPHLIPEWRQAWRMFSVNIAAIGAVLSGGWIITPHDQQVAILAFMGVSEAAVPMALFLLVILGRLVQQPAILEARQEPDPERGIAP
jgi:hypothetical protein